MTEKEINRIQSAALKLIRDKVINAWEFDYEYKFSSEINYISGVCDVIAEILPEAEKPDAAILPEVEKTDEQ